MIDKTLFPALSLDASGYARPAFLRLRREADGFEITNDWPADDPEASAGLAFHCEISPRARAERIAAFERDDTTRRLVAEIRAGWTRDDDRDPPPGMASLKGRLTLEAHRALSELRHRARAMTAPVVQE